MNKPNSKCPKCGYDYGFTWSEPIYTAGDFQMIGTELQVKEWLEWTCENCGYIKRTPTADKGQNEI